jgi:hypothetical protein
VTNVSSRAVELFLSALQEPSADNRAAAHRELTPDVELFGPFGVGRGADTVDALFEHPIVARLAAQSQWAAPQVDGDTVSVTATAPPPASVGGLHFMFHLDAHERIDRIEQDLLPATPLDPRPLELTDTHAELLAGALAAGKPVIVGYVDSGGRPHLSYRATVQALGTDRLGMWIRDPHGGLVSALATNPHLACFYSDRSSGVTLQFYGSGRVEPTEAIRDAIYEGSPQPERDMDWRKHGVAVVIDLERVEGRDTGGRVLMTATDPEQSV